LRSSLIVIEATIMSNFLALSAGIMPSHSCCTSVHSALMRSHTASAMSMSKPESLPSAPIFENGG
jgi:hypothetical protein